MPTLDLGEGYTVREYRASDLAALVRYADSAAVAAQVRDRFPHPFTEADGRAWFARVADEEPLTHFAIASPESLVGGIGVEPQEDIYRITAEIGYWLGEPFWGRGIATRAVAAVADWAFRELPIERLEARVFVTNPASIRVLEKAGFEREGLLRRSAIKGGRVLDSALYARVRDEN